MSKLKWLLVLAAVFYALPVQPKKVYPKKYQPNKLATEENTIITIKNGMIKGRKDVTFDQKKPYFAFRGIPYAKPPLGQLRFESPQPADDWDGIKDTIEDASVCVQGFIPLPTNSVNGSEDCLFVNVYTPNIQADLPVIVWVYGGGFIGGDSTYNFYGPDFFMNEEVIFVSFNYRVGIFGFFSTEDEAAPGNYGLKDQLLALKWVKENIKFFGGNPNNVTLFGESAGGASIAYLIQTPRAKGLFHKAITISGSSLCQWALSRRAQSVAYLTGAVLGINTSSSKKLVEDLRKVPYDELHRISTITDYASLLFLNPLNGLIFAPVIEPPHPEAIITNKSHEMLKIGRYNKVPQMIGFNSAEAVSFLDVLNFVRIYLLSYDIFPTRIVPVSMNISNVSLQKLFAALQIRLHYFGILGIIAFTKEQISHFVSDDQFARPIHEAVRLQSQHSPVYYFRFSYEGNTGNSNRTSPGVGHGEDLKYIFRSEYEEHNPNSEDNLTRYRLIKLFCNFAKYSNPTPFSESLLQNITWPVVNKTHGNGNISYLDIDKDLKIVKSMQREDMEFWQELYDTQGVPPFDTY